MSVAQGLLDELYEGAVPYQKVGVMVGGIVLQTDSPASLFAATKPDTKALLQAVDALNVAAGRELLTVGSRLQTDVWKSKSETRSPAYTTRWKEIAVVSA